MPPFRPLAAVSLTALLFLGREMWPAVFAAALCASLHRGYSAIPSLVIAAGNTIEPLLSSTLLSWVGLTHSSFRRRRDVVGFIAAGALAGPAIAAVFWTGFARAVLGDSFHIFPAWFRWLRSDAVSVLLIVPLFLAWKETFDCKMRIKPLGWAAAAITALVAIDVLVFSILPSNLAHAYSLEYLVFPFLIWVALQFGPHGATLGLLATGIITAATTVNGRGPFVSYDHPLMVLHIFLVVLAITTLIIAATVSEHRQTENRLWRSQEQLRASEERYRDLFENAQDFIVTLDTEGQFTSANKAVFQDSGFTPDEFLKMKFDDVVAPGSAELALSAFKEVLGGRKGGQTQMELISKAGGRLWVEVSSSRLMQDGVVIGIQSIGRNVTWRRRLEQELLHSQKMEAVGRLAGGVAHDFNNLLGVIIGYSDLLLQELETSDELRRRVAEIKKAGTRAAEVTRQLLAFSRKQVLNPRVIELNSIVSETSRMLLRLLGEDIELETRLSPVSPLVKVDPAQMQQVIMNLAINARDAMPHGGRLIVETMQTLLDETAHQGIVVVPGNYAVLIVTDTGMGMDEATRARVFEPFFTTKEDRGTGLGLATVYGFVKQSGGYIWVYSEIGNGATFKIYLPESEEFAADVREHERLGELPGGSETVLLVEDEESLRELNHELLEALGYTVIEAAHGAEALDRAEQYGDPIHLLVTDVVMPGMSGRELAERLAMTRPEVKVLYLSGYTDHVIVHHGMLKPGIAFLQKPFTRETLARKLREVLGSPDPSVADQL